MSNQARELNTTEGKNRFRYFSFKERIENLNFDVIHDIDRKPIDIKESGSYFMELLIRESETNLTAPFTQFVNDVKPLSISLPLILHHKAKITNYIKDYLVHDSPEILEPVLKLIPPLAKDLLDEFYPLFIELLKYLVKILDHKDAKIIEYTFNAIAYTLKNLSKSALKNLPELFEHISPLFSEKDSRSYLRVFAAESFGFLIRKSTQGPLTEILKTIFSYYEANPTPEALDGLTLLLVESVKNVDNKLHSRYKEIQRNIFEITLNSPFNFDSKSIDENNYSYQLCTSFIIGACNYTKKDNVQPINASMIELTDGLNQISKDFEMQINEDKLILIISILRKFISHRNGHYVLNFAPFVKVTALLFTNLLKADKFDGLNILTIGEILSLITSLLCYMNGKEVSLHSKSLINPFFNNMNSKLTITFSHLLLKAGFKFFTELIVPFLVKESSKLVSLHKEAYYVLLADIISKGLITYSETSLLTCITSNNLLQFYDFEPISFILNEIEDIKDWESLFLEMEKYDFNENTHFTKLPLISCYLTIISSTKITEAEAIDKIEKSYKTLIECLLKTKDSNEDKSFKTIIGETLIGQFNDALLNACTSVFNIDQNTKPSLTERPNKRQKKSNQESTEFAREKEDKRCEYLLKYWNDFIISRILPNFQSKNILKSIYRFATSLKFYYSNQNVKILFSSQQLKKIYEILTPSLLHYDNEVRLYAFQIMSCFEMNDFIQPDNNLHNLFSLCISVDTKPANLLEFRDKLIPLRKLVTMAASNGFPHFDYIVPSLCIGMFMINFRPLWSEAVKGLKACSSNTPKIVSELLFSILEGIHDGSFALHYRKSKNVADMLNLNEPEKSQYLDLDFTVPKFLKITTDSDFEIQIANMHLLNVLNPRNDRLDVWVLYEWVLNAFIETPNLAQNYSERFTKLFLDVYNKYSKKEDQANLVDIKENLDLENEDEREEEENENQEQTTEGQSLRKSLVQFLKVFSSFKKASKLKQKNLLEPIFEELLCCGDTEIQINSLKCIESYHYPYISDYSARLHNILDDVKFRDEVTTFDIAPDTEMIEPEHRNQLLPYLIKILFGRLISRKGRKSNKFNLAKRRTIILSYLSALTPKELSILFDILFKPFKGIIDKSETLSDKEFNIPKDVELKQLPLRSQLGFIYLLGDILKQLGASLSIHLHNILSILITIIDNANNELNSGKTDSILKDLRQQGLKRLLLIFNINVQFNFKPYMNAIFKSAISPKVENLAAENSQSPSSILEIISTWSKKIEFCNFLVDYDDRLLPCMFNCLSAPQVKPAVISLVLGVVENLFNLAESIDGKLGKNNILESSSILEKIIYPNVNSLLYNLEKEMKSPHPSNIPIYNTIFQREIAILSKLAPYVTDECQAKALSNLLIPSLKKSDKLLDEFSKKNIIIIISELIKMDKTLGHSPLEFQRLYQSFSRLFFTITLRESRQALLDIFVTFSQINSNLEETVKLLIDLNAYSTKRLDEPDYEVRLAAFTNLHENISKNLTPQQWQPVLYNLLYFLKDEEEMSLRNNGSSSLVKFMIHASETKDESTKNEFIGLLTHVIFPCIKKGLGIRSETIQYEYIQILGQIVKYFPDVEPFSDLIELLGSSKRVDQEDREDEIEQTNFFTGIYHIQQARRVKALSRLTGLLNRAQGKVKSPIRPSLLANIFLPICSDFIFADKSNEITFECIRAISSISRHLSWTFYFSLFRKYYTLIIKKPEQEQLFLKVLFAVMNGFNFDLIHIDLNESTKQQQSNEAELIQEAEDEDIIDDEIDQLKAKETITNIHNTVVSHIIPDLLKLLEKCSEDKLGDRIPIAMIVGKLLKKLPHSSFKKQLPHLILSLCNLLKSRDVGTRDTVRNTLIKIAQLLGAPHLNFIVKELNNILNRGLFRHILSYTLYLLLEALAPSINVGEIDHALPLIMDILVEDMFGEIGNEKDAADYTGKQKEVRARRSHLSLEILGTLINFKSLGILLTPIKQILSETDNGKVLAKVDEALSRISSGLIKNSKFEPQVLLSFCHGLISQNISFCQPKENIKEKKSNQEINFTVYTKRKGFNGEIDYFANNAHKFVEFGLNMLLLALKRDKIILEEEQKIDMLDPFIEVMGEILYSNYQPIVVLAIKNLLILIKKPLPSLELSLPVITKRILQIVTGLNSTHSDVVQNSFKLLAYIIRSRPEVEVSETNLKFLINLIMPDLEEPSRQPTTFALIRAILSRQLLVSSLYDLIDKIAKMMVTNQSSSVRLMCREVYVQFLLDYPHGTQRLDNQFQFLINNLNYEFESGRESVMEIFNALFIRITPKLLNDYSQMMFLALVMTLVNDDVIKCREMAGFLIKTLFSKLDSKSLNLISNLIFKWCTIEIKTIDDGSNSPLLKRAGLQALGLFIDAMGDRYQEYKDEIINVITESVNTGNKLRDEAQQKYITIQEKNPGFDLSHYEINTHWEIPYYALNTFSKMAKISPEIMYLKEFTPLLSGLSSNLLHPHTWIRTISSKLFGLFYSGCDAESKLITTTNEKHVLLELTKLYDVAYNLCVQIKSELFDDQLAEQWVKNLYFLGLCFYHLEGQEVSKEDDLEDDNETSEEVDKEAKDSDYEDNDIDENEEFKQLSVQNGKEDFNNQEKAEFSSEQARSKALKNPFHWLLTRLSFTARLEVVKSGTMPHKQHIFKLFAAFVMKIDQVRLTKYLIPLLSPVIRTHQDPVLKAKSEKNRPLLELVQEVESFIKSKAEPVAYMKASSQILDSIRNIRRGRKEKKDLLKTSNPEAYALAKLKKSKHDRANRKKRATEVREEKKFNKKKKKQGKLSLSKMV